MFVLRTIFVLFAVLLVTGCGASVRYAERVPGFIPGYVDSRLGEFTYQVKIGEAWKKDWPDLEKFAMYRASEVTATNGFRYFAVLSASSQINSYTIQLPSTTTTTGTVNTSGSISTFSARSVTTGGGTTNISGGWYTLDYRLISEAEIDKFENVVDSEEIISNLRYFIDSRR